MSVWKMIASAGLCFCLSAQVTAATDDSTIFGTHKVVFQPVLIGGVPLSCTLVYHAVQADWVYLQGTPIMVVGNIGLTKVGSNIALTMKIGAKNLTGSNTPFLRPEFAYLQTSKHTTAKIRYISGDGEPGFRLMTFRLEEETANLMKEMLDTGKVTIGFNRKKNGLDVRVPVDLTVYDAEPIPPESFRRLRSPQAIDQFAICSSKLMRE